MRKFVALATALLACRASENPALVVETPLDVPRVDGGVVAAEELGVRFGRENAKVGDRSHQHVHARSTWDSQVSSYESDFVTVVLAVEGPAPSRMMIEFRKNESFDNVSHQATSIDGHTYIVDVRAPHVVEHKSNAPPSEDEIARVNDVLPDLGTRSQIDQVLPDGAMRVGEHRDDIARAIARILHPRFWSVENGTAVLTRAEAGDAVFAIALDAASSASGMKIGVKGEARVRLRDARLEGFELKGEFARSNGEKGDFEVTRTVSDD